MEMRRNLLAILGCVVVMALIHHTADAVNFIIGGSTGPLSRPREEISNAHALQGVKREFAEPQAQTYDFSAAAYIAGCSGVAGMLFAAARYRHHESARAQTGVQRCQNQGPTRYPHRFGSMPETQNTGRIAQRSSRRAAGQASQVTVEPRKSLPPTGSLFTSPPATGYSLWHDVSLHADTSSKSEAGIFQYVNEMPAGGFQKFEMHTRVPQNPIIEHVKASKMLQAFGRPAPLNYGCFPQTLRDPDQEDDLCGAGGDNDALDVVELSGQPIGVGVVVRCRPLGAACVVDEGRADWKILVVNVEHDGPLASARNMDDVKRLAPGRLEEAFAFMDEFKKRTTSGSTLHFQIYDAERALRIIERDHLSWRRLLAKAGPDGFALGHWIRPPTKQISPSYEQVSQMMGASSPSSLMPHASDANRTLIIRRSVSPTSSDDGADSAGEMSEICASSDDMGA